MTQSLPLADAARKLDIAPGTLRRWLREGAPQARRGRRGRGRAALLDVAAIRAWRRQGGDADALTVLACELPELLGEAMAEAFAAVAGPHKRAMAGSLAAAWYVAATAVLDRSRADVPGVGELAVIPAAVERLRKIARG